MFKIKEIYKKEDFAKKFLKDQHEYLTKQFLKNGHCFTDSNDTFTHVIIDHEGILYKVGKKYMEKNTPKVEKK